jgi:hypothetical protein
VAIIWGNLIIFAQGSQQSRVQYKLTSTLVCPLQVSLIEVKSFTTMNCTVKADVRADLAVLQIKLRFLGAWDRGCHFSLRIHV